jgi:hypothetical protein
MVRKQLFIKSGSHLREKDRVVVILVALLALRIPGVHRMPRLMRERIDIREYVRLVVHHDERRIAVAGRAERPAPLSLVLVAITPAPEVRPSASVSTYSLPSGCSAARTFCEAHRKGCSSPGSERSERKYRTGGFPPTSAPASGAHSSERAAADSPVQWR